MSALGAERVVNIRGLLDEAKSSLCIGWDSSERQVDPAKVLEALCGIECALGELQLLEGNLEREDAEKAYDSGVHATVAKTSDDDLEPSVGGDVEEPEPSSKDDPVELARAMQRKRHGGAT